MRRKDLESLREHISYHESHLREDPLEDNTPSDDGLFGHGAEAEMTTTPGADDTPSESAMTQASDTPPTEGQTHAMEVDDEGIRHLQLAPSPLRMIYSLAVEPLGWRRTWPTLQSHLQGT